MNPNDNQARAILQDIAKRAMQERGLLPEFSPKALLELGNIHAPATAKGVKARDLRDLIWASIDNDDSLDLDQLTVAKSLPGGKIEVLVAVADVDALIKKGSAIDQQARHNTTSVYTAAQIFPMLPEKLSTNLTSLNLNEDRLAVVVEMVIDADGSLQDSDVYRGVVRNHAKLAYNSVAAWLEGKIDMPPEIAAIDGLAENLLLQDRAAQSMKDYRTKRGALCLETIEAKPIFKGDSILDLQVEEKNRAKDIIENFMIEANGVTVRYLSSKGVPSIRRVVRVPKRWERIVQIAAERAFKLPKNPDSKALEKFLAMEKTADPLRFPIFLLSSSSYLGRANMLRSFQEQVPPDTSGSPSRTTPIPLHPIAGTPI